MNIQAEHFTHKIHKGRISSPAQQLLFNIIKKGYSDKEGHTTQ
jgi:hypothetical protein